MYSSQLCRISRDRKSKERKIGKVWGIFRGVCNYIFGDDKYDLNHKCEVLCGATFGDYSPNCIWLHLLGDRINSVNANGCSMV